MKSEAEGKSRLDDLLKDSVERPGRLAKAPPVKTASAGPQKKRRRLRLRSVLLVVLALGGMLWISQDYLWNALSHSGNGLPRAALIDPLSETLPDQPFLATTMTALRGAGYGIDYYGPENSTVELFRNLPLRGYGLVIIRAHTSPAIFTGEAYSKTRYVFEQITDQLEDGAASNNGFRFAITDQFVRLSMHGSFANSLIVNMGCSGLGSGDAIAQAFVDKGARAYVGWEGAVTVTHTDDAIVSFLNALLGGHTVRDAVSSTMNALGPDPFYQSQLGYLDGSMLAQERFSQRLVLLGGLGILLVFLLPVVGVLYGLQRLGKK